jgi:hypothetical protein
VCLSTGSCLTGTQWSPTLCKCVPAWPEQDAGSAPPVFDAGSCQFQPCPAYDHWDESVCTCVMDPGVCFGTGDCQGLPLPDYCLDCADGSTGCAHHVCTNGACQIADCGSIPPFTLGQECGPNAKYPTCPMMIPCVLDDGGTVGHCVLDKL